MSAICNMKYSLHHCNHHCNGGYSILFKRDRVSRLSTELQILPTFRSPKITIIPI